MVKSDSLGFCLGLISGSVLSAVYLDSLSSSPSAPPSAVCVRSLALLKNK